MEVLTESCFTKIEYLRITSAVTEQSLQEKLKSFHMSSELSIFFASANMQENSIRRINHLRILIEKNERSLINSEKNLKVFVLLLHFPPVEFFNPCYPALFLAGWDHFYLDSLGLNNVKRQSVNVRECFKQCLSPASVSLSCFDMETLLNDAIPIASSRIVTTLKPCESYIFNKLMSVSDRKDQLHYLFYKLGFGSVLCEIFEEHWTPQQMHLFLTDAAEFTSSIESSLSISSYIRTRIQALFCDLIVFMLGTMNENGNLDIILAETPESKLLNFSKEIVKNVRFFSSLKYIHSFSRTLKQTNHLNFQFPFFLLIFNEMETITKKCQQKILKQRSESGELNDSCNPASALKKEIKEHLNSFRRVSFLC